MKIQISKSALYSTALFSATIALTMGLAGCSQTKTFHSVNEVKEAYISAGGTCTDTTPFSDFTEAYGIHGLNCGNNNDAVAWFETDKAKSEFLGLLEGAGKKYVIGPNWLVLTSNTSMITSSMGGEAKG